MDMPSSIIIPADVAKNLIENIQRYFECDAGTNEDFQTAVEHLDAVQHTLHDLLVIAGAESMYEDDTWMDNPYYINFRDRTSAEVEVAEDRASED
jgi:hypothetical protein